MTFLAALGVLFLLQVLALVVIFSCRNCISWAVPRFLKHGGYLVFRRSHFCRYPFRYRFLRWAARRIPHALWLTKEGHLLHYTVTDEQDREYWNRGLLAALVSAVHFKGKVKEGDNG